MLNVETLKGGEVIVSAEDEAFVVSAVDDGKEFEAVVGQSFGKDEEPLWTVTLTGTRPSPGSEITELDVSFWGTEHNSFRILFDPNAIDADDPDGQVLPPRIVEVPR